MGRRAFFSGQPANWMSLRQGLLWIFLVGLTGCGTADPPQFGLNRLAMRTGEVNEEHRQQIADILTAMFGTPDDPFMARAEQAANSDYDVSQDAFLATSGLDLAKLQMAAGSVASDRSGTGRGLFREHCVHCHGIGGDGLGPTAPFLNPYPRDYRQGKFKAKSTELAAKPTRDDLYGVLERGIPGTSMPSFKLLPSQEIDALVEYVKYLSLRGQTEVMLVNALFDLDEGEPIPLDQEFLVGEILSPLTATWEEAEEYVIHPPEPPEMEPEESIALGRELFQSAKANCVKCHGTLALGDGQRDDYDEWNRAYVDLKLEPSDIAAMGALPIRNIHPRNLRLGIYRFGRRPLDVYRRIHAGIAGTPMPGVGPATPGAEGTLTPDQIWHLVHYVRSLPYDELSPVGEPPSEVTRERL